LQSHSSKYQQLSHAFAGFLQSKYIITDPTLCFTLGTDASLYRLTPKIIVKVDCLSELKKVMQLCVEYKAPYTFRAAGTSLSGQGISDSVLIMLTESWKQYKIKENGEKIWLQPGVIGGDANRYLAPYHRKIGPDPASIASCKIGGIAANNSSGMCCGTTENTYQTVSSMTIVFADGCTLDTADILSVESFKKTHKDFLHQLTLLAKTTKDDKQLTELIHHKYRLKNTMGFSINALVDYDDPIDILQHLMIGSEGCLGFIADITYNTVVESQHKASSLIVYADIETSCNAVTAIADLGVAAVELIDGLSLKSVRGHEGVPAFIDHLDQEATALLLECDADSAEALQTLTHTISKTLSQFKSIEAIDFTSDTKICTELWAIRKGLMPVAAAIRKPGTSVIIEDITFPVENLAAGTRELRELFVKCGYDDAVVFGHALMGNLHFILSHDFSQQVDVDRYGSFMESLAELVAIKFNGSLKAEHGTGRNMAPYVEREWGTTAYQLMHKIKQLFDPDGLMNPGVVLNADKNAHINDLKIIPLADPYVDGCMECGFCEAVCPSRNLSLTPRQRIVMFRQLQQLNAAKQTKEVKREVKQLTKHFNYLGIESCAATGLCADRCPVGINTGELIRTLRENNTTVNYKAAKWTASHFALTSKLLGSVFFFNQIINKILPANIIDSLGRGIHKLSLKTLPLWTATFPTANRSKLFKRTSSKLSIRLSTSKEIVYLASCSSRTMGTQKKASDQRSLNDVTISLLEKAGYQIIIPDELDELCCGMPYSSQGLPELAKQKNHQLENMLWKASQAGTLPILIDTSPCKKYSTENFTKSMQIFEPCEFAEKHLLSELTITALDETIMLHITCSSRRMKLEQTMLNIAQKCAKEVVIPDQIQCCGWAGNKGFTTPELNQAALMTLADQVPDGCKRGFSNSLTCEIGLSQHSGIPYQSILYLLDEVSVNNQQP